jgi:hypothetical protein
VIEGSRMPADLIDELAGKPSSANVEVLIGRKS